MTIASEENRSGPYACNGVTTHFPYAFRIYDAAHIRVILTKPDGTETTLALGTDYTVSGVGGSDGGAVEAAVAHAAGHFVTLILNVPFTQNIDLENQGAYFAETIERAIDLQTQMSLQLKEQVARSVVLPVTSSVSVDRLTGAVLSLAEIQPQMQTLAPIAEDIKTVAGISGAVVASEGHANTATAAAEVATGAATTAVDKAGIAVDAAVRAESAASSVESPVSYAVEQNLTPKQKALALQNLGLEGLQNALTPFSFTAAAGDTIFNLGVSPSPNACIVSQNGSWLVGGGADYTIAGSTLTLTTPAGAGDRIVGVAIASFEVANALLPAANLADLLDRTVARANLGLGTAATKDTGTAGGNVPVLDPGGKLPALDGSQLTGIVKRLAAIAMTGGTFKDFPIPAGAKRITVLLDDVSTNSAGGNSLRIQVGTSAGVVTTGYVGVSYASTNSGTGGQSMPGAGFDDNEGGLTADNRNGSITLYNIDGRKWVLDGKITTSQPRVCTLSGNITLADSLTLVRITSVGSTDTFDNGTTNVFWE